MNEPPALSATCLIECNGVSKSFPGVKALADVNFDLRPGEIHALVGENGAGKSTLVKILSGAYQPDAGVIQIKGDVVNLRRRRDADKHGIVTIHQEITLVPELDVATNIMLGDPPTIGPRIFGGLGLVDRRRVYELATNALEELRVAIPARTRAGYLGVPAAQLVLLARGLSQRMQVLILDEPTAALTPQERDVLFERLRSLAARNVGIIYVSHRLEEITVLADRVTVLRDGKSVATLSISEASIDKIVTLMLARSLTEMYPNRKPNGQPRSVLTIRGLSRKGRPGLRSLTDISLTVRAGEIVGIAGLVGAGKSELAQAIAGVDAVDSGEILIDDQPVEIGSPRDALQAGISLAPEDRRRQSLILTMNLVQNIAVILANVKKVTGSVAKWGQLLNWRQLSRMTRSQIDRFHIRVRHPFQLVSDLSGGNQQKLVLAKCIAARPKVMIFDEPTRGIDVGSKAEIYDIINDLAQQGIGVLIVSSEIEEVVHMCDRIYVMRHGRLVKELNHEEADSELVLGYAAADR